MIRVLHMIASLGIGGTQAMIMNLYRKIDRSKIQFDFIIDHSESPKHTYFADEIKKLGGKIYVMPTFKGSNILEIVKAWNQFFKEHREYAILHNHVRSYACIYLPIAKKYGLKIIAHSHSTSNGKGINGAIKDIMQYPVRYIADYFFACSEVAGRWMFGENIVKNKQNYKIVKNAIDVVNFKYNREYDAEIRKGYNLKGKKIIGTVGRLCDAKNPFFILDVFKAIYERNQDVVLLWGGDGELREQIEMTVKEKDLQEKVKLLGDVAEIYKLYSAFDVFLFPSKWEGLGISLIEAQVAGLPCFVSERIPKEAVICESVKQLSLDQDYNEWADEIMKELQFPSKKESAYESVINAGYDINDVVLYLQNLYLKII